MAVRAVAAVVFGICCLTVCCLLVAGISLLCPQWLLAPSACGMWYAVSPRRRQHAKPLPAARQPGRQQAAPHSALAVPASRRSRVPPGSRSASSMTSSTEHRAQQPLARRRHHVQLAARHI
jgi:hypothetical protein